MKNFLAFPKDLVCSLNQKKYELVPYYKVMAGLLEEHESSDMTNKMECIISFWIKNPDN